MSAHDADIDEVIANMERRMSDYDQMPGTEQYKRHYRTILAALQSEKARQGAEAVAFIPTDEDVIEASYWTFDARRKGYGEWAAIPMAERDAYKAEMRAVLFAHRSAHPPAAMPVERGAELTMNDVIDSWADYGGDFFALTRALNRRIAARAAPKETP